MRYPNPAGFGADDYGPEDCIRPREIDADEAYERSLLDEPAALCEVEPLSAEAEAFYAAQDAERAERLQRTLAYLERRYA
jgi:hypothetical protein